MKVLTIATWYQLEPVEYHIVIRAAHVSIVIGLGLDITDIDVIDDRLQRDAGRLVVGAACGEPAGYHQRCAPRTHVHTGQAVGAGEPGVLTMVDAGLQGGLDLGAENGC